MPIRARLVFMAIALCAVTGLRCAAAQEQEPRPPAASEQPRKPSLTLEPAAGSAGSPVTARGSGFRGDCRVRLSLDTENGPVLGEADVDAAGSFTARLVIPDQAAGGRHAVLARGLRPGTAACNVPSENRGEAAFDLTPRQSPPALVLDPRGARPGGTLHVEGSGFCAESGCSAVTLLIDGQVAAGEVPVSPAGTFSVEAKVPATKTAGSLAVVAVQTLADQSERRAFGMIEVTPRPDVRREPVQ